MAIINTFRASFLENEILRRLSELVEVEIQEILQIIVFGSRARGESDEGSDLDIAIIADVPHIGKEIWNRIWDIKWRVLEDLQAEEFPLSLSLITMKDLISRDFGLEKAVKTEGILIWERKN
jgi:predicted nucleotidyltransferase